MTSSELYWITRLDNIYGVFQLIFLISFVASVIMIAAYLIDHGCYGYEPEYCKRIKKFIPWSVLLTVLSILCIVFIPTTKEMCVIKVVPAIVNSESVEKISNAAIDKAVDWLKSNVSSDKE